MGLKQAMQPSVDLSPYWRVVRPEAEAPKDGVPLIRLAQSEAFGDGTHPTTALCLLGLGAYARSGGRLQTVLDFGTGSGILAIGAARLGARVEAVEIDQDALASARTNARLNGLLGHIDFLREPSLPPRPFDLVLANILQPVLLEQAETLCARKSESGRMILSGLLATDVPGILARFRPLLEKALPEKLLQTHIHSRGEWKAVTLAFAPTPRGSVLE